MYSSLLLQFRKLSHLRTFVAMQEMSRFTRFGSQKKLWILGSEPKKQNFQHWSLLSGNWIWWVLNRERIYLSFYIKWYKFQKRIQNSKKHTSGQVWRTQLCDRGRLQTSQLQRMPPSPGEVNLHFSTPCEMYRHLSGSLIFSDCTFLCPSWPPSSPCATAGEQLWADGGCSSSQN